MELLYVVDGVAYIIPEKGDDLRRVYSTLKYNIPTLVGVSIVKSQVESNIKVVTETRKR